jgi:LPXTG-motif cell wall-anchored protein
MEWVFHLLQTGSEPYGPALILGVAAAILVAAIAGFLLYRRRIGILALWAILFAFLFGFSQLFPENRPLFRQIAVGDFVGSGICAWLVARLIRKHNQSAQK